MKTITFDETKYQLVPIQPEGWVMVPEDPTTEIVEAIAKASTSCKWPDDFGLSAQEIRREQAFFAYHAAIAAAPKPEE